ncbi:MAG: flavodoxin [Pyramidobacter sp.]|jgi:flavodoxin I
MSIAVVYGSTTGMTAEAACKIAEKLGAACLNVAEADPEQLESYDALVLGSSTWGAGDLQDDWEAFLPKLRAMNLKGKKAAVFGTGDHYGFGDTFCVALVTLRDAARGAGAEIIGKAPVAGYDALTSEVCHDGLCVGLALDSQNQPEMTEPRIEAWCAGLLQKL